LPREERPMAKVLGLQSWTPFTMQHLPTPPPAERAFQKHLSIIGWSPGGARARPTMIPEMIAGPWHVVLLQESQGLLTTLREQQAFHVVETTDHSALAIAARRTTFSRADAHHYHLPTTSSTSWGCVITIFKLTFVVPWCSTRFPMGHDSITVATMHLHNISAKKPGVAPGLLRQIDEIMRNHHVDIMHADFNMAASLGYVHQVFDDLVYVQPQAVDLLWGMPRQTPGDCCGFVARRSPFIMDAIITSHGTWDFDYHAVLGLRTTDQSFHYMNFMHLVSSAVPRSALRGAHGKAHRAARALTKGDRKRARREQQRAADTATSKSVATTTSKGPPSTTSSTARSSWQ